MGPEAERGGKDTGWGRFRTFLAFFDMANDDDPKYANLMPSENQLEVGNNHI